jgi:hypothetical protein
MPLDRLAFEPLPGGAGGARTRATPSIPLLGALEAAQVVTVALVVLPAPQALFDFGNLKSRSCTIRLTYCEGPLDFWFRRRCGEWSRRIG